MENKEKILARANAPRRDKVVSVRITDRELAALREWWNLPDSGASEIARLSLMYFMKHVVELPYDETDY